ncbi:hypothetical protein K0M31_018546 [Melipona bicolor]|uniref:Uncharacterized protein n=1 Tax=Melipona bicolor TaxID=60889 RepID=A0AA40G404_9HYME|nr:hypothetical protein K0M31_018546 [Melipona bicolor]
MTTSIANDSHLPAWHEKICESEGRNRIPGRISNYDERQISRSNTLRMSREKKAIQRAGNNSYRNKSFAERLSGHIVEFWHCSDATVGMDVLRQQDREGAWPGQRFGEVKSAERGVKLLVIPG